MDTEYNDKVKKALSEGASMQRVVDLLEVQNEMLDEIKRELVLNTEETSQLKQLKKIAIDNQSKFEKQWRRLKLSASAALIVTILVDFIDLNKDLPVWVKTTSEFLKQVVSS